MKHKLFYITSVMSVFLSLSCDDEYLDKLPLDAVSSTTFFLNDQDALAATNSLYTPLVKNRGSWQSLVPDLINLMGDDAVSSGSSDENNADRLNTTNDFFFRRNYETFWSVISRANLNISKITDNPKISEAMRNKTLGENYFMRGFCYFWLVRMFGGMPLILEPDPLSEQKLAFRATEAETYDQIISDLEAATELLPTVITTNRDGRPTVGAATGLLAKVYLYDKQYDKAKASAEEVIEMAEASGHYKLMEDYTANFIEAGDNNEESLFEIQFQTGVSFGHWHSGRNTPAGAFWNLAGNGGRLVPSKELYNAFVAAGDEVRRKGTIIMPGDVVLDQLVPDAGISWRNADPHAVKGAQGKFTIGKDARYGWDSPINWKILRLADVYLVHAEASMMESDNASALASINKVRARVNLPDIVGTVTLDHIITERQLELAYELQRWFDIKRWGIAREVIEAHGRPTFVWNDRVLLFPMPDAGAAAPNIEQNPGY